MLIAEAKQILQLHAGQAEDLRRLWFLDRLRPYGGLCEADFAEIVECMLTIRSHESGERVETSIALAISEIGRRSWLWVLRPDSSVRTCRIASDPELELLAEWIDTIQSIWYRMLRGLDLLVCAHPAFCYVASEMCQDPLNFTFLEAAIMQGLSSQDTETAQLSVEAWTKILESRRREAGTGRVGTE